MYASKRKGTNYKHSHEEISAAYGPSILMYEEMPEVLSGAMGDYAYIARFETEEQAFAFKDYVLEK